MARRRALASPPDLAASAAGRLIVGGARIPAWAAVAILAAMLAFVWVIVYASGGTQQALPHLFYVPIILAALPFGLRGALATALVAAVLCGPFMPMNTVTGEEQQLVNWFIRGAMFAVVGTAASLSIAVRARVTEEQLATEVRRAITQASAQIPNVDETLVPLVGRVLTEGSFHTVFQPIYSLPEGCLVAVEALTRFDVEPYRTPDLWFAAAERAGLGVELEIAAISLALESVEGMSNDIALSVNASPTTLADPRLRDLVLAHRDRQLVVEITEHAIVEDYYMLQGTVDELRALGVGIAVDDAGAGFASLRHIVQLAPDKIKVDISLTQGVGSSPLRRALAGALIEFAQHTGAELVIEGVEEIKDLTTWTTLGADAAQGYLVGRPGPLPVATSSPLIASLGGSHLARA